MLLAFRLLDNLLLYTLYNPKFIKRKVLLVLTPDVKIYHTTDFKRNYFLRTHHLMTSLLLSFLRIS